MDSVCKWIAILAYFFFLHQCRCGHRDRCDTGLINVHMKFEDIWNCWEERTLCADPHDGLQMMWSNTYLFACDVDVGNFHGKAGWES